MNVNFWVNCSYKYRVSRDFILIQNVGIHKVERNRSLRNVQQISNKTFAQQCRGNLSLDSNFFFIHGVIILISKPCKSFYVGFNTDKKTDSQQTATP